MYSLNSTTLHFVPSEDNQLVAAAFGVAALLAATVVYYSLGSKDKEDKYPKLPGIQLYHAWSFFRQRHDFLRASFERNSGQSFSFHVAQHKVIALTGEDSRRLFYTDSRMDFSEGIKILMGAPPKPSVPTGETETKGKWDLTRFNKTMNKLLSRPRLQNVLPTLLEDILLEADKWGNNGKFDPFVDIFDIVLLMTIRLATCHDFTKNKADLKKMGDCLDTLFTGVTPAASILPWWPSPSRVKITAANIGIFVMLRNHIEARRKAEPTSDAIDLLISEGETNQFIIRFVSTVIFAGVANTGIISCWILIDLAVHTEWREKCKKEIQDTLARHFGDSLPTATLLDKLSAVPISAWEEELPILDACMKESHRISFTMVSARRNLGEDIHMGDKVIERGDYLIYPMSEVHLNPEFYPDPLKYDPGRWLRPDPVPKATFPFLGWGAGRHPCAGMKVAKLEMKLIVAMFLMRYEYVYVGEDGKIPDPPPVPNRNGAQVRPVGQKVYFKYKKVME